MVMRVCIHVASCINPGEGQQGHKGHISWIHPRYTSSTIITYHHLLQLCLGAQHSAGSQAQAFWECQLVSLGSAPHSAVSRSRCQCPGLSLQWGLQREWRCLWIVEQILIYTGTTQLQNLAVNSRTNRYHTAIEFGSTTNYGGIFQTDRQKG